MFAFVLLLAYLIGSLPMGYIFIWLIKKQDITLVGSGRTGGTNAMRAGGVWVGLLTALFDLLKGYGGVMIARWLTPGSTWASVLAGFLVVLGHNWSIWLYLFSKKLSAGAGTGPNIGAAMALWPWVGAIVIPDVLFFVFIVGYASLASLSTALLIVIIFAVRAIFYAAPWEYIIYGVLTTVLVAWALRPNIQRLLDGTERHVGIFRKKQEGNSVSVKEG
jgi:glycerol-3-phosphate acyltransferase PlsY